MPGGFDFVYEPIPINRNGVLALVYRYNDSPTRNGMTAEESEGVSPYEWLPNIRVISISEQDGNHPWAASFRYVFDDELLRAVFPDLPRRVENVFGLDRSGPNVVTLNDRIVVGLWDMNYPEDPPIVAFDGYPTAPQFDLSPQSEGCVFEAYGLPRLAWDVPILDGLYRHSDKWDVPGETGTVQGVGSCRFNPESKPNCTVSISAGEEDPNPGIELNDENAPDEPGSGYQYPCFIDPVALWESRTWTLDGAVRYLVYRHLPRHETTGEFMMVVPSDVQLQNLLVARVPIQGREEEYDPSNSDTYDVELIQISDFDATGMTLPDALQKLLEPYGFGFRFSLYRGDYIGADTAPDWFLEFYRLDIRSPQKDVYLQPSGSTTLAPWLSNVASARIQRDGDVANYWTALSEPVRLMAAFRLQPESDPDPDDLLPENFAHFLPTDPMFSDKYRVWSFGETNLEVSPLDPETLEYGFPEVSEHLLEEETILRREGEPERKLVRRGRPGTERLTKPSWADLDGKEWRARLYVVRATTDNVGDKSTQIYPLEAYPADPNIGQQGSDCQEVKSGGWELLDDRLGIRLTMNNLQDWNIGEPPDPAGGGPEPLVKGNVVNVLKSTIDGDEVNPTFFLVLVTEIELDWTLANEPWVNAPRRVYSPINRDLVRADDVRDRFRAVYYHTRDPLDTDEAYGPFDFEKSRLAWHLTERRNRHELPAIAGSITLPRISYGYSLGDRIHGVYGRGIRLHSNATPNPSERGIFPSIVGITRTFDTEFTTTLSLQDRRADAHPVPKRYRR